MPELPQVMRGRLLSKGLNERDVDFLMSLDVGRDVQYDGAPSQGFLSFFEQVSKNRDPKTALNW
jgi:aspartyl-tRNA(Asn)/glutamyl-tRNA(Gln) amidotransferase subunit B